MGIRSLFSRNGDDREQRTITPQDIPAQWLQSVPGATVTPQNALTVADVYACVRALSDAAASLPLIPYRRRSDGSRERFDGRIADILERPAPAVTQANLIATIVAHLNLWGNCFIGKLRGERGTVAQLICLPPDRVTPELKHGIPRYTFGDSRGRTTEHGTQDILHIRGMSTDGLVGLSPIGQCRAALGLNSAMVEHAATFFDNDARPSGILHSPIGGSDALAELRKKWEEGHRGTAKAHRLAVVSGEIKFEPISLPADDMQFIQQRELSATEIARIFRVPPWIVGAPTSDSFTYSNSEAQQLHFALFSLRPWLVLIEQALSNDPDLSPRSVYVEFLIDALLRADHKTRAEVYTAALNPETGWMTRDEVRRAENLPPESELEGAAGGR